MNKDIFSKVINNKTTNRVIFYYVKNISNSSISRSSNKNGNRYLKWNEIIESPFVLVQYGYLDLLKLYYKRYPIISNDYHIHFKTILTRIYQTIVKFNRVDILKYYFDELNVRLDKFYHYTVVVYAINQGRWDLLDIILEKHLNEDWLCVVLLSHAPMSLSIDRLKYISSLVALGTPEYHTISSLESAALVGRVDMIEWLLQNRPTENKYHLALKYAIDGGHLNVIQYLESHNILFTYTPTDRNSLSYKPPPSNITHFIFASAIVNNRLDILIYLFNLFKSNNNNNNSNNNIELEIPKNLPDRAYNSNIEILQWLYENRSERCSENLITDCVTYGRLDIIQWVHSNQPRVVFTRSVMNIAAQKGYLNIVIWLDENRTEGCTTNAMDLTEDLEIIKWLHMNRTEGCTSFAMDSAASRGDLEIIQWLHKNRTEGFSSAALDLAVENGHLDVVKWLLAHRVIFGNTSQLVAVKYYSMGKAAINGHFEMVQWLHANRSEPGFVTATLRTLIHNEHYQLFKWIHDNRNSEFQNMHKEFRPRYALLEILLIDKIVNQTNLAMFRWLLLNVYDYEAIDMFKKLYSPKEHIYKLHWNVLNDIYLEKGYLQTQPTAIDDDDNSKKASNYCIIN